MKKLSLKYLLKRIQKIENEYQKKPKKPKIYTIRLHKKYERETIDDLKKAGWKEIADLDNIFYFGNLINQTVKLEKKVY